MDIVIRECEPRDIEALCRLNREEMGYDYPEELMYVRLLELLRRPSDRILVAESADGVCGYIHAVDYDLLYHAHLKNIMGIAVDSRYRRQGIGRRLLEAVEQWARDTGAEGIRLNSGSQRQGAHAFYESCGYERKKTQVNFFKQI